MNVVSMQAQARCVAAPRVATARPRAGAVMLRSGAASLSRFTTSAARAHVPAARRSVRVTAVAMPAAPAPAAPKPSEVGSDLSAPPPFGLADIRAAIPDHCWERNAWKSLAYLARDVAIVMGLAAGALAINTWWVWPLYALTQGTMFWALFVVGHDCGHRSFSANNTLNDFVGNIVHSSILVPYHGWRVSHRTHHSNHGHVENDESWHPTSKKLFDKFDAVAKAGRLTLPWAMLAYPFYLFNRSPGKDGSHFDPSCDLFVPSERTMVLTSNACLIAMLGVLTTLGVVMGPLAVFKLYFLPYVVGVAWLDMVTYLHHHGPDDEHADMPWYRGAEWSYLRGGLTTLDRDFGPFFNKLHHNIETHVVHHLFPQIPHYNLVEATQAVKPVLGAYYREPKRSAWFPLHVFRNLTKSFSRDHYVADTGDIVYYQKSESLFAK